MNAHAHPHSLSMDFGNRDSSILHSDADADPDGTKNVREFASWDESDGKYLHKTNEYANATVCENELVSQHQNLQCCDDRSTVFEAVTLDIDPSDLQSYVFAFGVPDASQDCVNFNSVDHFSLIHQFILDGASLNERDIQMLSSGGTIASDLSPHILSILPNRDSSQLFEACNLQSSGTEENIQSAKMKNSLCKVYVAYSLDNQYQLSLSSNPLEEAAIITPNAFIEGDKPHLVCLFENCNKTFCSVSSLRIHQRTHQTEKSFRCTFEGCEKSFKTTSELSRHMFRHTGDKPFKCDGCDKQFIRYDDLKRHYYIHTGEKPFKCEQCNFSCIQSYDLVKHKYTHGQEKPFKCSYCSREFTRPARLKEHLRLHTGEKPFSCEICNKTFTVKSSLNTHVMTHQKSKVPSCQTCNDEFHAPQQLNLHLQNHNKEKPHKCNFCHKEFISAKTLKRHVFLHNSEKQHECPNCLKRFHRHSDLKIHLPVHSLDKPFKCEHCEKAFTRSSTLKEHLRIHTGIPFKCDICSKTFNHQSHLTVHQRIHSGEKPFECDQCRRKFSRKSSLRKHLLQHSIDGSSACSSTSPSTEEFIECFSSSSYQQNSSPVNFKNFPSSSIQSHSDSSSTVSDKQFFVESSVVGNFVPQLGAKASTPNEILCNTSIDSQNNICPIITSIHDSLGNSHDHPCWPTAKEIFFPKHSDETKKFVNEMYPSTSINAMTCESEICDQQIYAYPHCSSVLNLDFDGLHESSVNNTSESSTSRNENNGGIFPR